MTVWNNAARKRNLRIYMFARRLLFACEPQYFMHAVKLFRTDTRKKRLVVRFLWLIEKLKLTWILEYRGAAAQIRNQMNQSEEIVEIVTNSICSEAQEVIIFFQEQIERRRFYAHIINDAKPQYFAKFLLTTDDSNGLESEFKAAKFCEANIRLFDVPTMERVHYSEAYTVLLARSIGWNENGWKKVRPVNFVSIAKEIARHHRLQIDRIKLSEQEWWRRFRRITAHDFDCFVEDLLQEVAVADELTVNFAHGDLGHHNLQISDASLILFDWENSCFAAPMLTDFIAAFLCEGGESSVHHFERSFRTWALARLDGMNFRRVDIMLALAYRLAIGINDIVPALRKWRKVNA
jgi:hypothetical protein